MSYKIIYPDELYHHGVKGMKWGVRREAKYDRKAQKWAGREENSNFRPVKRFHNTMKSVNELSRDRAHAINNSKSIRKKLQNAYGLEDSARRLEKSASMYKDRSKEAYVKSAKQRTKNERRSYNAGQMAKTYSKVANSTSSSTKRYFRLAKQAWNTPQKNVRNGKSTTYGKQIVKGLAVGVALNVGISAATEYAKYRMMY